MKSRCDISDTKLNLTYTVFESARGVKVLTDTIKIKT